MRDFEAPLARIVGMLLLKQRGVMHNLVMPVFFLWFR